MASLRWPPSYDLPPFLFLYLSLFTLSLSVSLPYFLFPLISSPPSRNTQLKMENGNEGLASLDASNSSDTKQSVQSFQTQGNKITELLFKLNRAFEVASRGYSFIISFSKALALHENILPFCMREVWVITACLDVVNATASHYVDGLVAPDIGKEFYLLQGNLYSLCWVKFMRLVYLIGYGTEIERSPVNSASLGMLPWPKPAIWPSVPPDALSEVFSKEKALF